MRYHYSVGKKHRNLTPKKPRVRYAGFRLEKALEPGWDLKFHTGTGELRFVAADGSIVPMPDASTFLGMDRGDGSIRPLAGIPSAVGSQALHSSANGALERFAIIVATDATPQLATDRYVAPMVRLLIKPRDGGHDVRCTTMAIFDCVGVKGDSRVAERIAWQAAVTFASSLPDYQQGQAVAVVTDHDVQSHAEINARTREALPGWSLPEGIDLVYGTGEKSPRIRLPS